MPSQILLPEITSGPARSAPDVRTQLAADLLAWWQQEEEDWDKQVTDDDTTGTDLWSCMPTVDSKTVARMAPVFERHERRPFDVRRIRRGGYASIDDVIKHLVFRE